MYCICEGLAKLMLRSGVSLLPAYSIGNTSAFRCYYDSFGVMEAASRWFRVSLFIPYGRWGLPIPFRANITMLFGKPIKVEPVAEPTQVSTTRSPAFISLPSTSSINQPINPLIN